MKDKIKSMSVSELNALKEAVNDELSVRQNELFVEKTRDILNAIESLREAFPHVAWEIEYETDSGEWQYIDLLWKYTPSGLVSCISR